MPFLTTQLKFISVAEISIKLKCQGFEENEILIGHDHVHPSSFMSLISQLQSSQNVVLDTVVFGNTGSVGTEQIIRYFRKSVTFESRL